MAERTYSTRELAQMWNVSESTIKRWADAGELRCLRTPGGHRKFLLEHILEFQKKRGFEATGLLQGRPWEDPKLEVFVNEKKFDKVRAELLYLASQNQRGLIEHLFERFYLRGVQLAELYDHLILPTWQLCKDRHRAGELKMGQFCLIKNNLEAAVSGLFPRMIRRKQTGRTGLCGTPDTLGSLVLNGVSRVLELEGWDCLNLGPAVPLPAMAQMVEEEPVNLVCVVSSEGERADQNLSQFQELAQAAGNYRIPLVLLGSAFEAPELRQNLPPHEYCNNISSLRSFLTSFLH